MSAVGTVTLSFDPPGLIEHTEHGDVFAPDPEPAD